MTGATVVVDGGPSAGSRELKLHVDAELQTWR